MKGGLWTTSCNPHRRTGSRLAFAPAAPAYPFGAYTAAQLVPDGSAALAATSPAARSAPLYAPSPAAAASASPVVMSSSPYMSMLANSRARLAASDARGAGPNVHATVHASHPMPQQLPPRPGRGPGEPQGSVAQRP